MREREREDALRGRGGAYPWRRRLTMPNMQEDLGKLLLPHRPCSPPCPLVCLSSAPPAATSTERERSKYVRERERGKENHQRSNPELTLHAFPRRAGDGAGIHSPPRLPGTIATHRCLPPSRVPPQIMPPPTPSTFPSRLAIEIGGGRAVTEALML
jgi:hypothetical protein